MSKPNRGGRPRSTDPRSEQVMIRLTVGEVDRLDLRCETLECSRSEAVRRWVQRLPTRARGADQ